MTGPLSHIRVLDLSRIMAGPWSGQILADLGADVIKVERPAVGDDTRTWGPPFLNSETNGAVANSGYFLSVNRGKRSVAVDLASADGQQIIRDLARESDIVLENFKYGTLERFGLSYEALSAINPGLIYCSITGFGQTGPMRTNAAYDFMIQAMGGLMSVTGGRDDVPGGGPQKVGIPVVDILTGMYATVGVLAALVRRNESGVGDYIDLAMLDVQTGVLANQAMNYLLSGDEPRRNGNRHPNIQPQDVFRCRDGHLVLAVGNDSQFANLSDAIGRPELAVDSKFSSNDERVRNIDSLSEILSEVFEKHDLDYWVSELGQRSVPCSPINTVPMALNQEQVRHRGMVREISHPELGPIPQVVSPLKFAKSTLEFESAPPTLGQHTNEVFVELGLIPISESGDENAASVKEEK